jgi:hypothetical protein
MGKQVKSKSKYNVTSSLKGWERRYLEKSDKYGHLVPSNSRRK